MKKKVQFIFAGRLVKEKGFDLVLALFDKLLENKKLISRVKFHIFSDGFYREELEKGIKKKWSDFVIYYGQQSKEKILKIWKDMNYTLVPSRFLETFGLVGLDSISVGVPIIGFSKGGLAQFMENDLRIEEGEYITKIIDLIEEFDYKKWQKNSVKAKKLFEKYRKNKWILRFQELSRLEPGAKILLVSDYIVDVGGIESFLFNVKKILEEEGYEVELIGCNNKRLAYNRIVSLFGTFWNNAGAMLFKEKVEKFTPELIWWHSIQRWFGPLVLYEARYCRVTQRVMYHDFGLFHPYPSKVYNEDQIYYSSTRIGYLKESFANKVEGNRGKKIFIFLKSILMFPLVFLKQISSLLIKRQLEKMIDIHLVPSLYMEKMIAAHYKKLKKEKIQTFNHFI